MAKEQATEDQMIFAAMLRGEQIDWGGRTVSGTSTSKIIQDWLRSSGTVPVLSIINARIEGDLLLELVGEGGHPKRLQILDCHISGNVRARSSHWRSILIVRTTVGSIDLSRATVDGPLVLELIESHSWLALDTARVAGDLSLCGSRFAAGDRIAAIDISAATISGELNALDLRTSGEFRAERVRIGADLKLDGARLDDSISTPGIALDLEGALVEGQVRLCQGNARFEALGSIILASAEVGAVKMRAARIDGRGSPAIAGDQVNVRDTVDLSGLSNDGGPQFEAVGVVQLGSSTIGKQLQLCDSCLSASGFALVLHGSSIGGDLLIGFEGCQTRIDGGIKADAVTIAGSVRSDATKVTSTEGTALSLRQARVGQQIAMHDLEAKGAIRFDGTEAVSISLQNSHISRAGEIHRTDGMPENYAHADDALLDFTHATTSADIRLEQVTVEGGDVRMNGSRVGSIIQIIMVNIRPDAKNAFLAQELNVEGGMHIGGSADQPAVFDGDVVLMKAKVGDLSMFNVQVGRGEKPANVIMANLVADSVVLENCLVHGSLNGAACRVERDMQLNSSVLINPGATAVDLRRAQIGGKLQFATARNADPIRSEFEGLVTANGASVGVLGWHRVKLRPQTKLELTNIAVERQVEAHHLRGEEPCRIDLSGTTTPLLVDDLDDDEDSWGAGGVQLGLDNFNYARLALPSGRQSDEASEIRQWRRKWLKRRYDDRSARPARHLAQALRDQGLFEASRLTLMDAFAAEGDAKPTAVGRGASRLFGLTFGHGLSGRRAAMTLLALWLAGALGIAVLKERHLLVAGSASEPAAVCPSSLDPLLASADLMIPVVDFGYEKACVVGKAPGAAVRQGRAVGNWRAFGELETYRAAVVVFEIIGWIALSLAVATWSGLFRRGGRD